MPTKNNIEWRITQLEKNYDKLDGKLDLILSNHLPHLESNLLSLSTRVNIFTAINLGGIILGLVATKFLK